MLTTSSACKSLNNCIKHTVDCSVTADDKSAPQWGVRGGGGRNRGLGGRFKGLDPVVPVTDPDILSSISQFYGIAQDFPLWGQLITRCTKLTCLDLCLLQGDTLQCLLCIAAMSSHLANLYLQYT